MREQRNSIRKKSLRQATVPNTLQQLQIPNDGVSCASSPNGSVNSSLAEAALSLNTISNMSSRRGSRGSSSITNDGQLCVSNSRKSSAASNNSAGRNSVSF